jgi:threonine dehydrogenase-like Zn-dependent dehydrogenase
MGYWYYGLYPHTFRLLADGRLRCDRIVTHELRGISRLPEALDLMARRRETGALQAQIVVYPAD